MKKICITIGASLVLLICCNYSLNSLASPKGVKVGEGIQVGTPAKQKDVMTEDIELKLSISSNKKSFSIKEPIIIEVRMDCLSDSQYLVDFSNLSASVSIDGRSTKTFSPVKKDDIEWEIYIDKNTFIGRKVLLGDMCEVRKPGTYQLKLHYSLVEEGPSIDSNELKLVVTL